MMEPIAIIGLGCLFPGAATPAAFWQNLLAGRDTTSTATAAEMGVDPALFYEPAKGQRDKFYALRGGFIRDFHFDPTGYCLPPDELKRLDDLFHWSLYVARQALVDSGYAGADLARCGVVLGNLSFPTRSSHRLAAPIYNQAVETALAALAGRDQLRLARLPANGHDAPENAFVAGHPATVLAQAFGLGAVACGLDAACASSLYALQLACSYLNSGRADLMLAGAVSCADPLFIHMGFSIFQAYPENGDSRPLDRNSRGLVSGEGAGMVMLKRYADAVRDGDQIHAVIRGIGLSNDGAGKHLLVPNPKGQLLALERAYNAAALAPHTISYVECHATGTPVGDITELNTMEQFFGSATPLIGSVKSNFGHLLTAAGMAGLLKVILSMRHGQIPPTVGITDPLQSHGGAAGGARVVRAVMPWPAQAGPLRAGISAFGFGGTNAHLVLEAGSAEIAAPGVHSDSRPVPEHQPVARLETPALAITGMAAAFGPWPDIAAFERALYTATPAFAPPSERRWKGLARDADLLRDHGLADGAPPVGAYLDQFDLDFLQVKIPPDAGDQPIPQQLLALKVADRALRDAAITPGSNVAVLIAMAAEPALHLFRARVDLGWQLPQSLAATGVTLDPAQLEQFIATAKHALHDPAQVNQYTSFIGNLMAGRVAALWDLNGPAFTVAAEELSVFRALELAGLLLADPQLDAVVVGAVDLAGGPESVLLRGLATPGEGAGALVLRRRADVQSGVQPIYATIEAVALAGGPDAVTAAARDALAIAQLAPAAVGYLELADLADPHELRALAPVYPAAAEPSCAAGSVSSVAGQAWAAAGMAALVKTALCLAGRYLPATPDWTAPPDRQTWAALPLYVPPAPTPWLVAPGARRVAAISGRSRNGWAAHVVLTAASSAVQTDRSIGSRLPALAALQLVPLAAADRSELFARLADLEHELQAATSLTPVVQRWLAAYAEHTGAPLALALVGRTPAEMLAELTIARSGIVQALNSGRDWVTPLGSCFSPRPLGPRGQVAFVYPGAFSSYLGLGRDLLQLFPQLHALLAERFGDPLTVSGARRLYPRCRQRLGEPQLAVLTKELQADALTMIASGTSFALLFTSVMRDAFGLQPAMACGYSMGESSMYWALGVWRDGAAGYQRLHASPLFSERLAGPFHAAREFLGLPPTTEGEFWVNYLVNTPAARVVELLRDETRVFLTQINTPDEVVIAGAPADVERVLSALGGRAVRAPFVSAIHCAAARSEFAAVDDLHRYAVHPVAGVRFYTGADYAPTELDSARLAQNIARWYCHPVDWPRMVDRLYADGARIFLELGPSAGCTRWTTASLAGREHLALAFNRRGVDDATGLLRLLAQLVAHRVPLNLAPLIDPPPAAPRRSLVRSISLGGVPIIATIVTEEHRRMLDAALPRPGGAPTAPGGAPDVPGGTPAAPGGAPAAPGSSDGPAADVQAFQRTRQAMLDLLPVVAPPALSVEPSPLARPSNIVWDEAALLEFARGEIARVFGPEYAVIDNYSRRVRLPTPPYLLVSRITHIDAERGQFRPSAITTEYDIPHDAWYNVDGQAPWAVSVESGQCDLFLISYLGIDFSCRGERVYRLLDCTLTFLDELPKAGDTLRYDIRINSFARSGDTLLFFFSYDCYIDARLVLKMENGCAGFFTDDELDQGRGVIMSDGERAARQAIAKRHFTPLLTCERRMFDAAAMQHLIAGDLAACFGPAYAQPGRNPSLRLPPRQLLMIDRICSVDPQGGDWGLGLIVGEHDLAPDHWYFPCHFQDDQVMAGSLMAEGCGQLLQFYMLFLGFQTLTNDARFQPVAGLPQVVRCRGQVTPRHGVLVYRMEITDLGLDPAPFAKANVEIILDGKVIVHFRDLGLYLAEKPASQAPVETDHSAVAPLLSAAATPRSPTPTAPVETAQRAVSASHQDVAPSGEEVALPAIPDPPPVYDEHQLTEFTRGSVVACFGNDYAPFSERRTPRTPNGDLQLMSRVLAVSGRRGDPRPGATLVSAYDVPADPWFYRENSAPFTPYSVLMELGLQPCGFLSAHLGTTLPFADQDFYFRNLDGHGELVRDCDIRGHTLVNRVELQASTAIDGVIIQKFVFGFESAGEILFRGAAAFGYFTPAALANQIGLDGGRTTQPWLAQTGAATIELALTSNATLFQPPPGQPHARLAGGRLSFLDRVSIVPAGGNFGQGYVYATRRVDPHDWFFACHFYQDPVMPGSLGVEAMFEALQAYALQTGLAAGFRSPRFNQRAGHTTVWKYRGQIVAGVKQMALELHIKQVEHSPGRVVVVAEGSLWRDDLRIYEVKPLALCLTEA